MAARTPQARRQRSGGLARLRGRAVHAADGHHLRAAGFRAGAGVPVGGADRPQQGTGQVKGSWRIWSTCSRWSRERKHAATVACPGHCRNWLCRRRIARPFPISWPACKVACRPRCRSATADVAADDANQGRAGECNPGHRIQGQAAQMQQQLQDMKSQEAELDKTVSADQRYDSGEAVGPGQAGRADARAAGAAGSSWKSRRRTPLARRRPSSSGARRWKPQLAKEKKLGDSAARADRTAEPADGPVEGQLRSVAQALDLPSSRAATRTCRSPISASKLNVALAAKVEELQQYRSEFFGKLRKVLGQPARHSRRR